ncbi:MAG TPA: hypothetical protein VM889_12250 [Candidatus Thermoplasmatota archaeon]|nr:hypothetical protein [Candidatus Thermoplasmatota archaeon]
MSTTLLVGKQVVGHGNETVLVESRAGGVRLVRRGGQELYVPDACLDDLAAALAAFARAGRRVSA